MTLRTWWLFAAITFVVSATPGPNMLFVMGLVLCLCRERQTAVGYLQRATVMRAFNRLTSGVFIGFAGLMAVARE